MNYWFTTLKIAFHSFIKKINDPLVMKVTVFHIWIQNCANGNPGLVWHRLDYGLQPVVVIIKAKHLIVLVGERTIKIINDF